mgnify:CR=1 FL=1
MFQHNIYNQANRPIVHAEGTWTMQEGFGFTMSYTANFENATLKYEFDCEEMLTLFVTGHEAETVELPKSMGYEFEILFSKLVLLVLWGFGIKEDRASAFLLSLDSKHNYKLKY